MQAYMYLWGGELLCFPKALEVPQASPLALPSLASLKRWPSLQVTKGPTSILAGIHPGIHPCSPRWLTVELT